ncbi:ABC transporter permease [Micromonospora sp. NBC_01655]|uniref:ABC transporter permease n=1 Tax=unclassified Micromonospora TaxID=2617518 RepID=UPI001404797D|nr:MULTISPECIES: ABC transporter permease [unclassified Micromonospora]MCX4474632.1 ABC transporter permease [Micromonospora sp. NBC_01655]
MTPLAYLASFTVTMTAVALLVELTGHSAAEVALTLYQGSFADLLSLGRVLDEATALLLVATGAVVCARAGMFNIGQEGQLVIGALAGAFVALRVPAPGWLAPVLTLGAAAAGGALWAGVAAALHYWRRVNVVIGTLLLIFLASQLVSFALNRDWLLQEATPAGQNRLPQSAVLPAAAHLPRWGRYPGIEVGAGALLAIGIAAATVVLLARSQWGFRLRLLGLNPVAARRSGVRAGLVGGGALLISGGCAGLAGGVVLAGDVHRMQGGIANNLGWEGLLVALVARHHPAAVVPVAVLFGALRAGAGFLASTGVPRYLVSVLTALIVIASTLPAAFAELRLRRRPGRSRS